MGKSKGPDRVRAALAEVGLEVQVSELPASTRTAADAAQAVGCEVGQIAKSLIFQGKLSGKPYLVVVSGSNQVEEAKAAALVGEELGLASPDFVREQTGYAIGGVPPLRLKNNPLSLIDEELLTYDRIWAAAGSSRAVFQVSPPRLIEVTGAQVANVRRDQG